MRKLIIGAALLLTAGAALAMRQRAGTSAAPAEAPQDDGSWVGGYFSDAQALMIDADTDTQDRNLAAFLLMIRTAEGTGDANGYRALFGHRPGAPRLFEGWADHPRIAQQFTDQAGRRLWTTAAGAYQFMARSPLPSGGSTKVDTWGALAERLGLEDFSPESQDRAAVELIRERGALADVLAGRFARAVGKVAPVWASLPGETGYAQPQRSIETLQAAYINAGGRLA